MSIITLGQLKEDCIVCIILLLELLHEKEKHTYNYKS